MRAGEYFRNLVVEYVVHMADVSIQQAPTMWTLLKTDDVTDVDAAIFVTAWFAKVVIMKKSITNFLVTQALVIMC